MADATIHQSDDKSPVIPAADKLESVKVPLPPIAETPPTSQREDKSKQDADNVVKANSNNPITASLNPSGMLRTPNSNRNTQLRSHVTTDHRVELIEKLAKKKPNLLFSTPVILASPKLEQKKVEEPVLVDVGLMDRKQDTLRLASAPEAVSVGIEHKEDDIALELYVVDFDINEKEIQEQFQAKEQKAGVASDELKKTKLAFLIKQFHCMFNLRNDEKVNRPRKPTLRLYLLNPTLYDISIYKAYFQEQIQNLNRIVVPCETESECCVFSKQVIHNPINPKNGEEVSVFISRSVELNYDSIWTIFDTIKQRLLAQQQSPVASQMKKS